jgi:cytochrome c oxidase subunit 2
VDLAGAQQRSEPLATEEKPSGSLLSAVGLAVVFCALAIIGTYIVVNKMWWFPQPISTIAPQIDAQFNRTMWISGIIFVLAQVSLGVLLVLYRDKGRKASYSHGNTTLEIVWTSATAVLFVGLAIAARSAWAELHFMGPDPGSMQIEVTGAQFEWQFRYPGPDGKFGSIDPKRISESAGNPLGLDLNEPDAKDDVVVPEIAVPVNRPIELILRTKDVIHNFAVAPLRIKQDSVPGLAVRIHFTADKLGEYEVACMELCGLGHYRMRTTFKVLSDADFAKWLKDNSGK